MLLVLAPSPGRCEARRSTTTFAVYFHNSRLAGDARHCEQVFPVARTVPVTQAVARSALNQLFAGPDGAEREQGYHSPFSAQTANLLRNIFVRKNTAYVDLHDIRQSLAGASSSCGSAEFLAEVENTLRQFATVKRVILAIEGRPYRFYQWIQAECDESNDDCDPRPFGVPDTQGSEHERR